MRRIGQRRNRRREIVKGQVELIGAVLLDDIDPGAVEDCCRE